MVNSVTYFALIFKLVETQAGGGGGGEGGAGILRYYHIYIRRRQFWEDIFGWSLERTNLGVISLHFRGVFFLKMYLLFFFGGGGHKISNIYLGTPDIPDIFIG